MPDEYDLLLWGTRAFAGFAMLLVLAIFAWVWWVIVRPVITEAVRARRAGDWWLPFMPQEGGGWGPLTANRRWGAFRAAERGTAAGLAVRWGFWAFVAVALTLGIIRGGWQLATLAVLMW